MVEIELKHALRAHRVRVSARHGVEVPLHFERDAALDGEAHGVILELAGDLHVRHGVAERLLDKIGEGLKLLVGLVRGGLLLVGLETEILRADVAELLLGVAAEDLRDELVRVGREAENIEALGAHLLGLRELRGALRRFGGGVIDVFLVFRHRVHILAQGDELFLLRAAIEQKIGQQIALHAVIADDAVFELRAEHVEELFVLLAVALHEPGKLAFDLLFKIHGDELELAVVLEHLAGDVQRKIGRIDDAAHEAEAFRQQVGALFHDHHAVGVEPQAGDIVARVVVIGRLRRDEQHRAVAHGALGVHADDGHGILGVLELLLIEGDAVGVGGFLLAALPDGDHRVDDLFLCDGAHAHLLDTGLVHLAGLIFFGRLHIGADRPADIVRIFLHKLLDLPGHEIHAVAVVLGVALHSEDDVGADGLLFAGSDGVAVRALALPAVGGLLPVGAGDDGDLARDHERGIEAHAELTDHVDVRLVLLGGVQILLEGERAGLRDHAEIGFHLLGGHADAVVGDRERSVFLVAFDADEEISALHADILIGQRAEAELVDSVRGVGDQLAQKDLLMRVDGIDHQLQQPPGFRLKFFFRHIFILRMLWTLSRP